MKPPIFFVSVAFLIMIGLTGAYFSGLWIPNNPSPSIYPIRGIDVSGHQGKVDWKLVAEDGINFVYLKATEGGNFRDTEFDSNLRGAREAGLACGAYHFFSLKTNGLTQAQNFIKTVPKEMMALPPAVDLEFWGNSSERPSSDEFQRQLRAYLDAVAKEYGRDPIIYTSADFTNIYLKGFSVKQPWVRAVLFEPGRDEAWSFWQFTERARVPGINGFVDMDVFHSGQAEFHLLIGK
jgi:lysozyme